MLEIIAAVAGIAFLMGVYVTDSSEKVVEPFERALLSLWDYLIDTAANRLRIYGELAIKFVMDATEFLLYFAGGLLTVVFINLLRGVEKYAPVFIDGLLRVVMGLAILVVEVIDRSINLLVRYGPPAASRALDLLWRFLDEAWRFIQNLQSR